MPRPRSGSRRVEGIPYHTPIRWRIHPSAVDAAELQKYQILAEVTRPGDGDELAPPGAERHLACRRMDRLCLSG
jgi:hypothetical protein